MSSGYYAVEQFTSEDTIAWTGYINFSKLSHLEEVITLDESLCPSVIKFENDADYECVNWIDDGYCGAAVYTDLAWVLERVKFIKSKQVLFIWYEPTESEVNSFKSENFSFCGFDLVDHLKGTSAILNCGGFDKAFTKEDLSHQGLITVYSRAREIQELLQLNYPDEGHAECQLWAIWRYNKI